MQSTHTLLCQYTYDALDRLVNQHQPAAPAHQRFYCKSRLATEIHGALKHSILQHDDLLLAEQRHEGVSADTTLLATDLQRSVLNTVTQGVKPQPIAYSPYGHRPPLGGLLSLLGFNGERPDPVTGHYLLGNGYRAFNPVLMRFNSPDSLSPFGKGGLNCYAYCAGDPMNRHDKTGHNWFKTFIKNLPDTPIKPTVVEQLEITHIYLKNQKRVPKLTSLYDKKHLEELVNDTVTRKIFELQSEVATFKLISDKESWDAYQQIIRTKAKIKSNASVMRALEKHVKPERKSFSNLSSLREAENLMKAPPCTLRYPRPPTHS